MKFIIVALVAIGVGIATVKLADRKAIYGVYASMLALIICLIFLAPAGHVDDISYIDAQYMDYRCAKSLPCKHANSLSFYNEHGYQVCTSYGSIGGFLTYTDDDPYLLRYCEKCYTCKDARKYYSSHKSSSDAFLN